MFNNLWSILTHKTDLGLHSHPCHAGLYLPGWSKPKKWDPSDSFNALKTAPGFFDRIVPSLIASLLFPNSQQYEIQPSCSVLFTFSWYSSLTFTWIFTFFILVPSWDSTTCDSTRVYLICKWLLAVCPKGLFQAFVEFTCHALNNLL